MKASAARAAGDEGPRFPEPLDYLWAWFCQLSSGLKPGGWTPVIVTWEALAAWCWLTDISPEPWEVNAIMKLSMLRASIDAEHKAMSARAGGGGHSR